FFSCGFLAGLILGFMADQIASGVLQLGEAIGRSIHHTAGKILTGSENVSTNSRPAARAVLSTVKCDNHIAEKRIAQGSENIYINSQPAEQTRHDKQYIHHLAQPVRNFRTDFQYRLRTAAQKHIRRTVFNHRVAFG
ncbi:PAAR domain-containing protein, partial [Salmonella enterica]|uniref:PAAR domain-containing protein n=1 Tax=Salmonella enterica TaxID=28901 RepID=UPI003EDC22E9